MAHKVLKYTEHIMLLVQICVISPMKLAQNSLI